MLFQPSGEEYVHPRHGFPPQISLPLEEFLALRKPLGLSTDEFDETFEDVEVGFKRLKERVEKISDWSGHKDEKEFG